MNLQVRIASLDLIISIPSNHTHHTNHGLPSHKHLSQIRHQEEARLDASSNETDNPTQTHGNSRNGTYRRKSRPRTTTPSQYISRPRPCPPTTPRPPQLPTPTPTPTPNSRNHPLRTLGLRPSPPPPPPGTLNLDPQRHPHPLAMGRSRDEPPESQP